MCPHPPTAIYERLLDIPDLPQGIRDIAEAHLQQPSIQDQIKEAARAAKVLPSTNNPHFACEIYSLKNKAILPEPPVDQELFEKYDEYMKTMNTTEMMRLPGEFLLRFPVDRMLHGVGSKDDAAEKTLKAFKIVWELYQNEFQRNSIDDNGLLIHATIHLSRGFNNAYWDGQSKTMYFGDAGRFDGRFWLMSRANERGAEQLTNWKATYSLDIIGHELTHGVVQHTANLGAGFWEEINGKEKIIDGQEAAYSESATLNEHIADCFGVMVKHYENKDTVKSGNWDMANGWYSELAMSLQKDDSGNPRPWNRDYMRTFRIPGSDEVTETEKHAPKHWTKIRPFSYQAKNGSTQPRDPHVNMGVGNHAFYLAAQAFGDQYHTWERVGKIWYAALTDPVFRSPQAQNFKAFAELTAQHAGQLFPNEQGEDKVKKAWQQVGL